MTIHERPRLDRGAVVQAAATLADEGGLPNLTLAELAARLDIRSPSLYNHVRGLDGLRRELAILGYHDLAQRLQIATSGTTADAAVAALARGFCRFGAERPGVYAAMMLDANPDDAGRLAAATEFGTVVHRVLAAYNLSPEQEQHAIREFRVIFHGYIAMRATHAFIWSIDPEATLDRLIALFITSLRPAS